MAYRFKLQAPIAESVRRVALEQIEMVEAKLGGNGDASVLIHDARRSLKRLRALLRLVRPALEDEEYEREAERLSGIAKLLATARDTHVMRQTLAKLAGHSQGLPKGLVEPLQATLASGPASRTSHGGDGRQKALLRLKQTRKLFTGKALREVELTHILEGVERTYDKAHKAFRKAYRKPSDEAFHTWRKAVQQHWRHMQLLSRSWPEALSARAAEAKELSRMLGEDHDYAVLLAFAQSRGRKALASQDLAALTELCRTCQAELRKRAEPRGARLFAEAPDSLTQRLARYWTSAEVLAALPPRPEAADAAPAQPARASPAAKRSARKAPRRVRDTR